MARIASNVFSVATPKCWHTLGSGTRLFAPGAATSWVTIVQPAIIAFATSQGSAPDRNLAWACGVYGPEGTCAATAWMAT